MIWSLIGSIGGKVLDIVDVVVKAKDESTNLMYGAAVCRLCYYRKAEALPEAGDIEGQGQYWKTHYNTPLGKGTVTKYVYKEAQGR